MKKKNMKNVTVTTEKVDAKEVRNEYKEPVFVDVKPASVSQYWKSLSFKKKIGLILGTIGVAAAGYFVGRSIIGSEAETETLELPSDVVDINETEIEDEVE